ncbi:unnamed protein product [Ceutorhynchus assimilis]|uniref:Uncharacterized protein n=1 Tax=Ceutorhynchus assimilis TaxID=467358 RepID=A0A9N9ML08_9CUCU|nr:unnamed protein product [Ceutorhynchus assimilis]
MSENKNFIMDEINSVFDRFANLLERDIKGVHIGCYSVALISLTIALRKVRPFSKFKRPNDIPNHFINEKRELTGQVKSIDPNGTLLMVEHKPLVDIPLIKSGQLPVKISGINVSGLGMNWIQSVVVNREIKFVPVSKDADFLQCQVILVQKNKNKRDELLNVGESLVKIGFAQLAPTHSLAQDPALLSYFKKLQAAESVALRNQLGLKYYIKPTKAALRSLARNLTNLSKYLTFVVQQQIQKVPQMARA